MFAAKRTERVIGRIMLLTNSIRTIKGIRTEGVPIGTRCAKNSVKLFVNLNNMKAIHRGKASERVIAKCLVAVKVKDKSPIVLLVRITMKSLVNKSILIFLFFSSVSNSLFMALMIFLMASLKGLERAQYDGMIRVRNKVILSQFIGIDSKATGSKIENRLFIIFSNENSNGSLAQASFC